MAQTVEIVRNVLKGLGIAALVFSCLICGSRANDATAQGWTKAPVSWSTSASATR